VRKEKLETLFFDILTTLPSTTSRRSLADPAGALKQIYKFLIAMHRKENLSIVLFIKDILIANLEVLSTYG
jgi:hypothetical protein